MSATVSQPLRFRQLLSCSLHSWQKSPSALSCSLHSWQKSTVSSQLAVIRRQLSAKPFSAGSNSPAPGLGWPNSTTAVASPSGFPTAFPYSFSGNRFLLSAAAFTLLFSSSVGHPCVGYSLPLVLC
jgi:hypothetical protein